MEKSGYDGFVCADESSINHSFNFESDNFNLETLYKVAVLFYKGSFLVDLRYHK